MELKQKLHLSETTKHAIINTKLNGESLSIDTRNEEVGHGYYILGHEFRENDNGHVLESWTVENSIHCLNSRLNFDKKGNFVNGTVNCFALGFMDADAYYAELLIKELCEEKDLKWDFTE